MVTLFFLLILGFKTCCDLTLFAGFFKLVAILSDSKVKFMMKRFVKQGMKRYTVYILARGLIPVEHQYTASKLVNSKQVILDPIVRNRSLRGLMLLPYVSFHWIKKTRNALTVL